MSEYALELSLCATLETQREWIVSRQLGASASSRSGRILDVVCVEPGPEFDDRVALTSESIPAAAIESTVGPGRARPVTACFDGHPAQVGRIVDRAVEIGFFERERRGGREFLRQVTRYPDWFDSLVGIEIKPDLGRPGDLETQLRVDVGLALVDEVILVTESYVTRAHLNRIPAAVGVWRVTADDSSDTVDGVNAARSIEVVREPTPLAVDSTGVEPVGFHPGRTDVAVVSPETKRRLRRRIAERAYGKGWRTFDLPACGSCDPDRIPDVTLPYCQYTNRIVHPAAECGPSCAGYDPVAEPPATALEAERERRTPWVSTPSGAHRRQSGLDRFVSESSTDD